MIDFKVQRVVLDYVAIMVIKECVVVWVTVDRKVSLVHQEKAKLVGEVSKEKLKNNLNQKSSNVFFFISFKGDTGLSGSPGDRGKSNFKVKF